MNKRGQLDEINPIAALLAVIAGVFAYFLTQRVPDVSRAYGIISALLTIVAAYFVVAKIADG